MNQDVSLADGPTAWADTVSRAVARVAYAFKSNPGLTQVELQRSPAGLLYVREPGERGRYARPMALIGRYDRQVTLQDLIDDIEAAVEPAAAQEP